LYFKCEKNEGTYVTDLIPEALYSLKFHVKCFRIF